MARYGDDENLRGVEGWLKFMVVMLMILSPVVGVLRTAGDLSQTESMYPQIVNVPNWGLIKIASWIAVIVQSAILISAGQRLRTRFEPFTVRYTIAAMWISAVVVQLLGGAVVSLLIGTNLMAEPETLGELGRSILWAGIWTAYLVRSERVRVTYYNPVSDEAEVFA